MKIRLSRYGKAGWEFSVTQDFPDGPMTHRYCTTEAGDGLWEYCASPNSWYPDGRPVMEYRQTRGTSQFWLPTERKPAYDKIRHEWQKETS